MHLLVRNFTASPPYSIAIPQTRDIAMLTGKRMIIEMKTKRRWIVSVLEAVAEQQDTRLAARMSVKHGSGRGFAQGQKGFAMRLKAATRPLAEAAR